MGDIGNSFYPSGVNVKRDSGRLTDEERAVLDHLVKAYNGFKALPVQHPMHRSEFCHSIHEAQRLVMIRPVARAEGWVYMESEATKIQQENGTFFVGKERLNDGEPAPVEPKYAFLVLEEEYDQSGATPVMKTHQEAAAFGFVLDKAREKSRTIQRSAWVQNDIGVDEMEISLDTVTYRIMRIPVE